MAIRIQSIERENTPPCRHFVITVVDDGGQTLTIHRHVKDPAEDLPALNRDNFETTILFLLNFYVNRKGLSLNDLVGKVVIPDVI